MGHDAMPCAWSPVTSCSSVQFFVVMVLVIVQALQACRSGAPELSIRAYLNQVNTVGLLQGPTDNFQFTNTLMHTSLMQTVADRRAVMQEDTL